MTRPRYASCFSSSFSLASVPSALSAVPTDVLPWPGSSSLGGFSPRPFMLHQVCFAGSAFCSSGRQANPAHQVCVSGIGAQRLEAGRDSQPAQPFVPILIGLLQPLERLVL